jgi:hypothetical protein
MKNNRTLHKAILTIVLGVLFHLIGNAQDPTYTLSIKNIKYPSPNVLQFDIYLLHTNYPTPFIYGAAQYFFGFNNAVLAGDSVISGSIIESELPKLLRPRVPSLGKYQGLYDIRMAGNSFQRDNTFEISHTGQGTLIARVQLTKKTGNFDQSKPLDLKWKNGPENPVTLIYATIDEKQKDVTDPSKHH